MRVYVSGPISGMPDNNRLAFKAACERLQQAGHETVNPHDVPPWQHEGPCPEGLMAADGVHTYPCAMRGDMVALLGCDAIFMMSGWLSSTGARAELELARVCGLVVLFQWDHSPTQPIQP